MHNQYNIHQSTHNWWVPMFPPSFRWTSLPGVASPAPVRRCATTTCWVRTGWTRSCAAPWPRRTLRRAFGATRWTCRGSSRWKWWGKPGKTGQTIGENLGKTWGKLAGDRFFLKVPSGFFKKMVCWKMDHIEIVDFPIKTYIGRGFSSKPCLITRGYGKVSRDVEILMVWGELIHCGVFVTCEFWGDFKGIELDILMGCLWNVKRIPMGCVIEILMIFYVILMEW